jgi:hypothetical protein
MDKQRKVKDKLQASTGGKHNNADKQTNKQQQQ